MLCIYVCLSVLTGSAATSFRIIIRPSFAFTHCLNLSLVAFLFLLYHHQQHLFSCYLFFLFVISFLFFLLSLIHSIPSCPDKNGMIYPSIYMSIQTDLPACYDHHALMHTYNQNKRAVNGQRFNYVSMMRASLSQVNNKTSLFKSKSIFFLNLLSQVFSVNLCSFSLLYVLKR